MHEIGNDSSYPKNNIAQANNNLKSNKAYLKNN